MTYTFYEFNNGKRLIIKNELDSEAAGQYKASQVYDYKEIFTPTGASIMVTRYDDKKMNPAYTDGMISVHHDHAILSYDLNNSSIIVTDAIKKADASASGITLA